MSRRTSGKWRVPSLVWCLLAQACAGAVSSQNTAADPASPVTDVNVLRESGGRVDWSAARNLIVYDRVGRDGYYDVYVMGPDGGNDRCLTCDTRGRVPHKHNGNPAWHPSGRYIVFQAEKVHHPGASREAQPGFGRHSDLWLATADGERFYQLTNGPATTRHGVLHPQFSHDGKYLTWSEMYQPPNPLVKRRLYGFWKLKIAQFELGPQGPGLVNIRDYQPGGPAFYENHGLSVDGRTLLFTSNFHAAALELLENDIYIMDLEQGIPVRLASERYNEHAHYSPNGEKIVWMTSAGNTNRGTDLWMMNADGTGKIRLTNFNDSGSAGYTGQRMIAADSAWSPDGARIVAYVQTSLLKQTGMIVVITLDPAIAGTTGPSPALR